MIAGIKRYAHDEVLKKLRENWSVLRFRELLIKSEYDSVGWSRSLTRIANVAFQPPCICVFGSNPRSSGPCNAECHTLDTVPPGIPSYVFPTGVFETVSNHWASSVAEADWRGTRRCKVLKERRSNQDSSEPIMLPKKVRSHWSCNHSSGRSSVFGTRQSAHLIPTFQSFDN